MIRKRGHLSLIEYLQFAACGAVLEMSLSEFAAVGTTKPLSAVSGETVQDSLLRISRSAHTQTGLVD